MFPYFFLFPAANIRSSSELEGTASGVLAQVNVAELTPIPELNYDGSVKTLCADIKRGMTLPKVSLDGYDKRPLNTNA